MAIEWWKTDEDPKPLEMKTIKAFSIYLRSALYRKRQVERWNLERENQEQERREE